MPVNVFPSPAALEAVTVYTPLGTAVKLMPDMLPVTDEKTKPAGNAGEGFKIYDVGVPFAEPTFTVRVIVALV